MHSFTWSPVIIHTFAHSLISIHLHLHSVSHSFSPVFIHLRTHSLACSPIHTLLHQCTHSLICSLIHSFLHLFTNIYLLMHLSTHLFTCVLIHSPISLSIQVTLPLISSFTSSFISSFTWSFSHSLIHPFPHPSNHSPSLSHTSFVHIHSFTYYHSLIHSICKPLRGLISQLSPKFLCVPNKEFLLREVSLEMGRVETGQVGNICSLMEDTCVWKEFVCGSGRRGTIRIFWRRSAVSDMESPLVTQTTGVAWMSRGGQVTWPRCPWSLVAITKGPCSPTPVHATMRGL